MNRRTANGIVQLVSHRSVDETLGKLKRLLEQKEIALFVIVDHSGEAAKSGLSMPPTKLAIFGTRKVGTPVMIASPSAAIDLPLKILVSENKVGGASYRTTLLSTSNSGMESRTNLWRALLQ